MFLVVLLKGREGQRRSEKERRKREGKIKTQKLKKYLTAAVALVPARVVIPAFGTRPFDKPVRQESPRSLRVKLLHRLFLQQTRRVELGEQRLRDCGLLPGGRPPKAVAGDIEPFVYRGVHRVVLVAERRAGEVLLDGLGLGRGAVFVLERERERERERVFF